MAAGYLKKLAKKELSSRMISCLRHPTTEQLCTEVSDLQDAANTFYQNLYSPTEIDHSALDKLLNSSSLPRLSVSSQEDLQADFTIEDLQQGAKRAPAQRSPGPDGLPYSTWYLTFKHP